MKIPVVPLKGIVILPRMLAHFDMIRDKSIAAVQEAMMRDQKVMLVMQRDETVEDPGLPDLYTIGTVAEIKQLMRMPDGVIRVLAEGRERAELHYLADNMKFLEGEVDIRPAGEEDISPVEREAMLRAMKDAIHDYGEVNQHFMETASRTLLMINTLPELISQLMIRFPVDAHKRQKFLSMETLNMQYSLLMQVLAQETDIGRIRSDIQEKVQERLNKNQREYMLREQIKTIREELGDDDIDSDVDEFLAQTEALEASDDVREAIRKEIKRFRSMPPANAEGTVSRTYIETLLAMPWDKAAPENVDIKAAEKILNADHYGLEKVKERILDYLAVREYSGNHEGSILCLVGPPGTGKTSVAISVARALNKKYVRVCLGGVHDEAEIRGHRRTYIGAMPGRIAAGMKQAGVCNPLMLLDEIDKVSSDYKGDTGSALLEVLDPEQNKRFADHYIELPMDLSRVLFIATANTTQTIPKPLLDRMEIIEIGSYTENEKLHIAKEHLIKKQRKKNGLTGRQLSFTEGALKKIIHSYTREAGVRQLEREIGEVCRKAARKFLTDSELKSLRIKESDLKEYLGIEKVHYERAAEQDDIGIVRGLAWTSVGGDTLEVEVNIMPGKGKIQLTGQMGDVMKESAQAGLSYIRSVADHYHVAGDYFEEHDIHIHIPEGAVPKDGPSAGITMATGMLSAITLKKVRADLAMTGEVTLRGRVLPIGGLKEKLLAAKQAGIRQVLVPEKNRPDVAELSSEITDGLRITYVSQMDEVIENAFAEA